MKNLLLLLAMTIGFASINVTAQYPVNRSGVSIVDGVNLPWRPNVTYDLNELVFVNERMYYANTLHVSSATFNPDIANWTELAAGGISAWVTAREYNLDEMVYDPLTDKIYRVSTAHTAGVTFAGDIANWVELSSGIPAAVSSTDNAISRWDGATGDLLQDSGVLLDDTDNISGINDIAVGGTTTLNTSLEGFVFSTSGVLSAPNADVSSTELGYLDGVTSALQTQLDSKEPDITGTDGDLLYWNSGLSKLGIGTNGQLLRVSALGFPEWADVISVSVTTKGDIQTYATAPDRLPVGTNGQLLSADSIEATGLKWIDPPTTSPTTTEGDLILRGATEDERFPIGASGKFLKSNGTTLEYGDIAGLTPLMAKGSLFASNGITNGEFTACADGEYLEWDALEVSGFKCATIAQYTTPLTTDGDLLYYNSGDARLAAGTANQLLTMVGGFPVWADAPVSTTLANAGEIQTHNGTNNIAQAAPTAEGQFLVADLAEPTKMKWTDSITGLISQAMFVGKIGYSNNCLFSRSSAAYGKMIDADVCGTTTLVGDVSQNTNPLEAGIKIPNFRTDGYYSVVHNGLLYNGSDTAVCYYSLSKTSNFEDQGQTYIANSAQGGRYGNSIRGDFRFNDGDTGEIFLISKGSGTTCHAYGTSSDSSAISVHFFPDSTSLAAVQNKQLNAKTANEFAGRGICNSTASITTSTYNHASSITNINGAGRCTITYSAELQAAISQNMNVVPVLRDSGANFNVTLEDETTTGFTVQCNNTTNGAACSAYLFNWVAVKNDVDLNKSQVITGTFENINSTDLYYGEFKRSAAQTIPSGAGSNVIYNETIKGNLSSEYNQSTGIFTAPRDGVYQFCPKILWNTFAWGVGNVGQMTLNTSLASPVLARFEAPTTNDDYYFMGTCHETFLNEGNTAAVNISHNNGVDVFLLASAQFNTLTISEKATHEAIVASLGGTIGTLTGKGQLQGHDGSNAVTIPAAANNGMYPVSDDSAASGIKWNDHLTGTLNAVTDWIDFTPTAISNVGAYTNVKFKYKRIGDSAHIRGEFTTGIVPIAAGSSSISFPAILPIDISDFANGLGDWRQETPASTTHQKSGTFTVGASFITFTDDNTTLPSSGSPYSNPNSNVLMYDNTRFTVDIVLPIVGWSSGLDAVVQDKLLTAETVNELSAVIAAAGTVTSENYDFINGNCTISNNEYTCPFNAAIFTQTPVCQVSAKRSWDTARYILSAYITGDSSSSITFVAPWIDDNAAFNVNKDGSTNYRMSCSKQGADVNKSQVITGTFENINSSEISMVRGVSNAGETPSAAAAMPFIELKDTNNEWDGNTFTAKKDMRINAIGSVRLNSSLSVSIRAYVNGIATERCGTQLPNTTAVQGFNCSADLVAGDTFYIGNSSGANQIAPSTQDHWIYITESADTESIIKNLNDNNNVECQTKNLLTSFNSTGVVSDISFNNLEIGKKYEYRANFQVGATTGASVDRDVQISIQDGATNLLRLDDTVDPSASMERVIPAFLQFTAATTLIQANFQVKLNSQLFGLSSGTPQTTATLCELPDNYIINSTKFN